MKQNKPKITRHQFNKYRAVQLKGWINMADIQKGTKLTGLPESIYQEIQQNYTHYKAIFT